MDIEKAVKELIDEVKNLRYRVEDLENPIVEMPETDINGRIIIK